MFQIQAYFHDGSRQGCSVNIKPDECPICHVGIEPTYCIAYCSLIDKNIEVIWRCPNNSCSRLFISYYENGNYKNSVPNFPEKPIIDERIIQISNRFYNIYTHALAAKAYDLTELVGAGLRKALEILIKDFCISKNSSETETIKKNSLHDCIEQYCDGHVKKCAHKCRVLGNDETHYERKYESKDISDLEKLIQATLYWIGAELISDSCDEIKIQVKGQLKNNGI